MAKTVQFGIWYQMHGTSEMELPDEIDIQNQEAIIDYIEDHWDEVNLPTDGSYVSCSAELNTDWIDICED